FIFLIFAAYFIKYIPETSKNSNCEEKKQMNYYAVFLPMLDPEKSKKHRQEHLDFVEKMRNQGHIFLFGRLIDGAGGLIIYQGNSQKDIEDLVKNDPYVLTGARGCEVHEWAMSSDYTFHK